jgi:hypothetical protein
VEPHYHPNPIQTYLPFDCAQYSTAITERKGSHSVPPSLSQFNFFGVKLNFFKNWKPCLEAHIETNNVKDLSLIGNFLPNASVNDDICSLRSPVSELLKMSHKRNEINFECTVSDVYCCHRRQLITMYDEFKHTPLRLPHEI